MMKYRKLVGLCAVIGGTLWMGSGAHAQNAYIPTIISAPGPLRPLTGVIVGLGSSAFNRPVGTVSVPVGGPLGPLGPQMGAGISPALLATPGLLAPIVP